MLIQLLPWVDRLSPHRRLIHVLAGVFAAFLAASFALDYGHWTRTEEFHGPFQRSADDAFQYVVPIGTETAFLIQFQARSRGKSQPFHCASMAET